MTKALTPTPSKEPPPGWGKDKLTDFYEHARGNAYATYAKRRKETSDLIELDRLLIILSESIENSGLLMEGMFLLRAHSAFRAAAYLAMSGQVIEAFAQNRLALECALFGLHMHKNEGTDEIWLRRSDSEEMKETVRAEFSINRVFRTLKAADSKLDDALSRRYDDCVSYGGHPLEEGFMAAMRVTKEGNKTTYAQVYAASDGAPLRACLCVTAQVGIGVLRIFRNFWKERMALLDLDRPLEKLAKRY
jgi:hypothetical protein